MLVEAFPRQMTAKSEKKKKKLHLQSEVTIIRDIKKGYRQFDYRRYEHHPNSFYGITPGITDTL